MDGVSPSYSQWQRSCCCGDHSVGKLGPGRVCAVILRVQWVRYAVSGGDTYDLATYRNYATTPSQINTGSKKELALESY